MSAEIISTTIPGCYRLSPAPQRDTRGCFYKIFTEAAFQDAGLATSFCEHYWSRSHNRVLRGLHFQVPPYDCDKLVVCMEGRVLDVIVDLRIGSPAFGKAIDVTLDGGRGEGVYVPRGLAHGFYVQSEMAVVSYAVTAEYSQSHDTGILWRSIGFRWPDESPVVSARDAAFPPITEFASPFRLFGY